MNFRITSFLVAEKCIPTRTNVLSTHLHPFISLKYCCCLFPNDLNPTKLKVWFNYMYLSFLKLDYLRRLNHRVVHHMILLGQIDRTNLIFKHFLLLHICSYFYLKTNKRKTLFVLAKQLSHLNVQRNK